MSNTMTFELSTGATITIVKPLGICEKCLLDPSAHTLAPVCAFFCTHNGVSAILQPAFHLWSIVHPVSRAAFDLGLKIAIESKQETPPAGPRH